MPNKTEGTVFGRESLWRPAKKPNAFGSCSTGVFDWQQTLAAVTSTDYEIASPRNEDIRVRVYGDLLS